MTRKTAKGSCNVVKASFPPVSGACHPITVERYTLDTERARKNEQAIRQALQRSSQTRVAQALGTSEASISRMKSEGDLEEMARFLAACGLKVVDQDCRVAKPEVIDAAMVFARAAINRDHQELVWEDEAS